MEFPLTQSTHAHPTNNPEPVAVCVRNLSLSYGAKAIFSDISMDIRRHRVTAVMGPSGCGKSSFLSCLNRLIDLIPGADTQGRIMMGDTNILEPGVDVTRLRRRLGTVFQKPNPFPISIRKNIQLALREHGIRDKRQLDELTESSLRQTGLFDEVADRLDKSALCLSGGQQQRLCIARAIALKPQILLMDEPCSALDPIAVGCIEELITTLSYSYTVVLVTHNLAQAKRCSDDSALFWPIDGRSALLEFGATDALFSNSQNVVTNAYIHGHRT